MTFAGWAQLVALIVALGVTAPLLGRYIANVYDRRRRRASTGSSGRSSGSSTARAGSIPSASSAGTSTRCRCSRSASSAFFLLYVMQRFQSGLPFNPTDMAQRAAGARVQHRGELRDQHELAELRRRDDDESPHPDGGSHGAAVRVRRGRHGGDGRADPGSLACRPAHDRQLLGRSRAHDLPHPAAARVRVRDRAARHAASSRTRTASPRCTRSPARRSRSRVARTRAWSRSSSWERTAATSSTSTPRTRSRTRPSISNFLELYAILIIPFALAFTFGRMVKDKRQGYAVVSRSWSCIWLAFSRGRDLRRGRREPEARRSRA